MHDERARFCPARRAAADDRGRRLFQIIAILQSCLRVAAAVALLLLASLLLLLHCCSSRHCKQRELAFATRQKRPNCTFTRRDRTAGARASLESSMLQPYRALRRRPRPWRSPRARLNDTLERPRLSTCLKQVSFICCTHCQVAYYVAFQFLPNARACGTVLATEYSCVDGRYPKHIITTAGGDAAEFMLGLQVLNVNFGLPMNQYVVSTIFRNYMQRMSKDEPLRKFYYHTDEHAWEHLTGYVSASHILRCLQKHGHLRVFRG